MCLPLRDPVDCSPLGSSVHGILQTRILEWVTILFSRGSFWPRDWTRISYISCIGRWVLYCYHHLGSPDLSSFFELFIHVPSSTLSSSAEDKCQESLDTEILPHDWIRKSTTVHKLPLWRILVLDFWNPSGAAYILQMCPLQGGSWSLASLLIPLLSLFPGCSRLRSPCLLCTANPGHI